MDNKEKKNKSWLNEEVEGAEELQQKYDQIFGSSNGTQRYSVEEWEKKTKQFREVANQWHRKHPQ